MNSIALFYNHNMKVELDVNICILEDIFLELGMRFICNPQYKGSKVYDREVFLYLPFTISNDNIESLSLDKEIEIISALFNESVKIEVGKYTKVSYSERNFCIRNLYDNDLEFIDVSSEHGKLIHGKLVKFYIRHNPDNKCDSYYYRLRIRNINKNEIITKGNISSAWSDLYYTESLIVDFNVNRKDALPKEIVDRMKYYHANIYKANTFIIVKGKQKKIFSNVKEHNIKRNVKGSIWGRYYNEDETIFFYHYKTYNVLANFEYKKLSTLYHILLITIFLSVIASFVTLFTYNKILSVIIGLGLIILFFIMRKGN